MHIIRQLKEFLWRLDIFSNDTETNQFEQRVGRIATRIFFILFFLLFLIYILFNALITQTVSVTFYEPSQNEFERLQELYPNTIVCPCRNTTIPHESFISLTPIIHPICLSGFVSDEWISYTINTIDRLAVFSSDYTMVTFYTNSADFEIVSAGQYQGLQGLCIRAQQTLQAALKIFAKVSFITDTAKKKEFIEKYFQESVMRTINTIANEFLENFNTVANIIQAEKVINTLQKNYAIRTPMYYYETIQDETLLNIYTNVILGMSELTGSGCSCDLGMRCVISISITDKDMNTGITDIYYTIPTYYSGCDFVSALLNSSLTCFFDFDCVDFISSTYMSYELLPSSIKPLNKSQLITSTLNTTVNELINRIFIEQWNSTMNYSGFFTACSPLSCTYSYIDRHSFLYILSEALGIICGLIAILSLLIPMLTRLVMKRIVKTERIPQAEDVHITQVGFIHRLWKSIVEKLKEFNIFEDSIDTDDPIIIEHEKKNGRIATKIVFVLLVTTILMLSLILRFTTETTTISVGNPTRSIYEELLLKQKITNLDCRCKNIAVSYNQIIQLDPIYHPFCYSHYDEQLQFQKISQYGDYPEDRLHHFILKFPPQLLFAKSACVLAEEKVTNALTNFYSTSFVSTQLLTINLLTLQAQSFTRTFIDHLAADFILTVDIMNVVIQNNHLLSASFNNWQLFGSSRETMKILSRPAIYDNCSCSSFDHLSCASTMILGSLSKSEYNATKEPIPGIFVACSQVESLKRTNLALFFNQTAVEIFLDKANTYGMFEVDFDTSSIKALNASQLGVIHQPNTSMGDLLADLFVEEWNPQILFDQYFNACAPASCSYQIITNRSYLSIITFVLGLFGGLVAILRLSIFPLVRYFRRKYKPQRTVSMIEQSVVARARQFILKLDIFSKKNEINMYKRRNGILATRFYIITLIILLITLGLFNATTHYSTLITVASPSQTEFYSLYDRYPDTLQCLCEIESFPYRSFIDLKPQLHPICASTLLVEVSNKVNSQALFGVLRSLYDLCKIANRTIDQSLTQFLLTQYISTVLVAPDRLVSQTQAFIDGLIQQTSTGFVQKMNTTINYIQSNQHVSALMTNYDIIMLDVGGSFGPNIATTSRVYANGSCDCYADNLCSENAAELPGFRVGCYIIEALRQSQLHCFFNETCMMSTFSSNKTLMKEGNITLPMSINELINSVFVITWGIQALNYADYFDICQPTSCTYVYTGRRNLLLVITLIIGIFGGLSDVLKLLVPASVKIVRKIYVSRKQRFIQVWNQ